MTAPVETVTRTNETRRLGAIVVQRYRIIGTRLWVYNAWEPLTREGWSTSHSLQHAFNDAAGHRREYGRVGTCRNLPPEIEALPAWAPHRALAVGVWYEAQFQRAYALIVEAFPEAAGPGADEGAGTGGDPEPDAQPAPRTSTAVARATATAWPLLELIDVPPSSPPSRGPGCRPTVRPGAPPHPS